MNRARPMRRMGSAAAAALLLLLAPGCKDDSTAPEPDPDVSLSLQCMAGINQLMVENGGGAMRDASAFIAAFADGESDTLLIDLGAGESATCPLSNIHGGVTVTNEEWDLTATAGDCLTNDLQTIMAALNLATLVPSPLMQTTVIACVYTVNLRNLDFQTVTTQVLPTASGLTVRFVFSTITGNLSATSPGLLCPDLTGSVSIASVVVETEIVIGDGDDPQVTLGETEATVNGIQVTVDGTFGFIVEWISGWFEDTFTSILADMVGTAIESSLGADLSDRIIVNSGCGL